MRLRRLLFAGLLAMATSATAQTPIPAGPLTFHNSAGYGGHIFPSVPYAQSLGMLNAPNSLDSGPLLYHGGPIMQTGNIYAIYWAPPFLQDGNGAGMLPLYRAVNSNLLNQYMGHGLGSNNTQYYQVVGGVKSYIWNKGMLVTSYVDTNPYPASGCKVSSIGNLGNNCITDAQLITEIKRVMSVKGWHASPTNVFMVFTAKGESSCIDPEGSVCSYAQYCGYHSATSSASTGIIYIHEPFGQPYWCQVPGTSTPNTDYAPVDTAANVASVEITEATIDPKLNSWFTAKGNEIGDPCAYNFGTNTWDGGLANQSWGPVLLEIQTEFDNHASGCVQVGP